MIFANVEVSTNICEANYQELNKKIIDETGVNNCVNCLK
jgi:hypothetical protein